MSSQQESSSSGSDVAESGAREVRTSARSATTNQQAGGNPNEDLYSGLRRDIAPLVESETFRQEEEYWLQEYQSAASIFTNVNTGEQIYHVLEPDLDEFEHLLYRKLEDRLRQKLLLRESAAEEDDLSEALRRRIGETVDKLSLNPAEESIQKVTYYLQRNLVGHGRIQPLMQDPKLEEISCNGPGEKPLFVYHQDYDNVETNIRFDEGELRPYVRKLAQRSGKDISTANPTQGTTLSDGSRIQMTLEEVSPEGETFTIRKFRDTPFTPVDLIKYQTFSAEQMAYLWYITEHGVSGLFTGGTGAGKTTSLNAVSLFIEPGKKIITIEDTREVKVPQKNYVSTLTREGFTEGGESDVAMYDLLVSSLRMRPEYLIVGEVRGDEAYNLFQAMNTGHTSLSTLHADSMQTVLSRLQSQPMDIPKALIAELGFVTIQTTAKVDGEMVRRNQGIYEVLGHDTEQDQITYRPVFEWDQKEDKMEQTSESSILKELKEEGRSPVEAVNERKKVLDYLVQNDITDYDPVTSIVRSYMRSPEAVLRQVEADRIDLEELASLENQTIYEDNV